MMTLSRICVMMLISGFLGGSLALHVHAQNTTVLGERAARLEAQSVSNEIRLARLESDDLHHESEIATISGIGIGIAAVIGALQALQILLARSPRN